MRKNFLLLVLSVMALSISGCGQSNRQNESSNEENTSQIETSDIDSSDSQEDPDVTYLTVSEAIALANEVGEDGTAERQYVTGIVKNITNANYGEMYITDGTNDLYIYGVYSKDGTLKYPELEEKPYANDEVFLYGFVKTYKGSPEMGASWLQKMISHQGEVDINDYEEMSILGARNVAAGSKVRMRGVVAHISHANGMIPNGFYLVDNTSSIYVYSTDVAGRVEVGEEIEIAGVRDNYILDSEKTYAAQYGYQGSIQIADAIFVSSINKNKEFDKSWINNSTVKEMIETPFSDNVTTKLFKVNAIVNKVPGTGFTNYYIDDLDNETGSYIYTLCNGSDYSYLDVFDGKICTVYLSLHNAKSTKSGAYYRLMPILVEEKKSFAMTDVEKAQFALTYYVEKQFQESYLADPELELLTSVDNSYIPFNGVKISYESSDTSLLYFVQEDGKTVMHTNKGNDIITVTLTAEYSGQKATSTVKISVVDIELPETTSVADIIASDDGETVNVRGIVMSSLVNQVGFYINDGTGVIAVRTDSETIKKIGLGNEVVMSGTRTHVIKSGSSNKGQSCIDNATLIANLMGKNNYDTSTFITDKTFEEIFENKYSQAEVDLTTNVYVAKCYLTVSSSQYSKNYYIGNKTGDKQFYLYAGSGKQYDDFSDFADGREIILTFTLCDWNSKSEFRACIISATDGTTTILNTLNFK